MSLYYAERQELAKALRKHVRESNYDDAKKILLLSLIDEFEPWGLSRLDPNNKPHFMQLLEETLE